MRERPVGSGCHPESLLPPVNVFEHVKLGLRGVLDIYRDWDARAAFGKY